LSITINTWNKDNKKTPPFWGGVKLIIFNYCCLVGLGAGLCCGKVCPGFPCWVSGAPPVVFTGFPTV
jgi:hypothetical protein